MTTRAVNLRHEEFDVYVGRRGHGFFGYFGNPFGKIRGSRGEALRLFTPWFAKQVLDDREFLVRVLELRGLRLGCFCRPFPCHAQVYVDFIENFPQCWADALVSEWRLVHPRPATWMSDLSPTMRRAQGALS